MIEERQRLKPVPRDHRVGNAANPLSQGGRLIYGLMGREAHR